MSFRPGYDGTRSVEEVSIDNPLASLALDVEGRVRTSKTVVTVNVTESPIEHMFHRGEIDDRLRKAADIFRKWCEQAVAIGGGINYESVVVDQSRKGLGFPEKAVHAVRRLENVRSYLGMMDYDLLCQAVAIGNTVQTIAAKWYPGAETLALIVEARRHVGKRIKDALAILASLVGLGESRTRPKRKRLVYTMKDASVHARSGMVQGVNSQTTQKDETAPKPFRPAVHRCSA